MSRKILAFYSPYPGAGKTTAAKYLAKANDGVVSSFAYPLYNIVFFVLNNMKLNNSYYVEDLRGKLKNTPIPELGGASVRDMLLKFGSAGRELYPDIWVDCARHMINCWRLPLILVDDLRFPNEYAMLRDEGAKIVRITNPGREIVPAEAEALLEDYAFDATLCNNPRRGPEHYHEKLDALLTALWPDEETRS